MNHVTMTCMSAKGNRYRTRTRSTHLDRYLVSVTQGRQGFRGTRLDAGVIGVGISFGSSMNLYVCIL